MESISVLPADAVIMYFTKYESDFPQADSDSTPHTEEVDVTAHKCNHFESIHHVGLGQCPVNIPWSVDVKMAANNSCGVCNVVRESGFAHACTECFANVCLLTCCVRDPNDAEGSVTCNVCMIKPAEDGKARGNAIQTQPDMNKVKSKSSRNPKRKTDNPGPSSADIAVRKENVETNAKWRSIVELCKRTGYLAPSGQFFNTTWWKDVHKYSVLLPAWDSSDRPDFFFSNAWDAGVTDMPALTKESSWLVFEKAVAEEIFELAKTHGYLQNWAHDPALKQRLQKVIIHIPGHTRALATMWGELENITEDEKERRLKTILVMEADSAMGKVLLKTMETCRAKIPKEMEGYASNLDLLPYDITINFTTGPMPHHADEDKWDGGGGWLSVLSINIGTMFVFGEFAAQADKENGPEIRHKWLGPGQFLVFCDKMRVDFDTQSR
jgi:hypothetical protein